MGISMDKQKLEELQAKLNNWEWPEELGRPPASYKDGRDHIRGAYKAIDALLHPRRAKAETQE